MRKIRGKKFWGRRAVLTTKKYLLKGMQYWAKDSCEMHKKLVAIEDENKILKREITSLQKQLTAIQK